MSDDPGGARQTFFKIVRHVRRDRRISGSLVYTAWHCRYTPLKSRGLVVLTAELNTTHDLTTLKGGPSAAELNTAHNLTTLKGGPLAAELNTAHHDLTTERRSIGSGAKHSS